MNKKTETKAEEIDSIRVYQAVNFGKKNESHFSARAGTKKVVKLSFHPTIQAVLIESPEDRVIVPLTNVSSITLKSPSTKKAEDDAAKELKALNQNATSKRDNSKRPK